MDLFKLLYYIEVFSIALGMTFFVVIMPKEIITEGRVSILTVLSGSYLWYVIVTRSEIFYELLDKWFKR